MQFLFGTEANGGMDFKWDSSVLITAADWFNYSFFSPVDIDEAEISFSLFFIANGHENVWSFIELQRKLVILRFFDSFASELPFKWGIFDIAWRDWSVFKYLLAFVEITF